MPSDLITQTEYLTSTGKNLPDLTSQEVAQINWAISAASEAVRAYADRDFTLVGDAVQGPREFRYYGNSILDIDDATAVNQVSTKATSFAQSRVLDPTEWYAMPMEDPIFTYIELYSVFLPTGKSPEMGFTRNLDQYPWVPYPIVLVVDASWGWPTIPRAVKEATVLTVELYTTDIGPYNAESIAGYSRSYARTSRFAPSLTIQSLPDRAAALLDPFTRWPV